MRHRDLSILLALAAVACFGGAGCADDKSTTAGPRTDWPRFHLSLDNAAHNRSETILRPDNVGRLKLKWSIAARGSVWGSPVVAGNRVVFGDNTGALFIADRDSGAILHQIALGNNEFSGGAQATPTIEGDVMYFQDAGGSVFRYDLSANRVDWTVQAPPNNAGFSSPAVFDGRVYFGWSNGSEDSPCTVGTMQAVDKETGAVQWVFETVPMGYVGGGVWNAPAVDETRRLVIFGTANPPNGNPACGAPIPSNTPGDLTNSIVALNADTGQLVWHYKALVDDPNDLGFSSSSPVLFNDGTRDLAGAGQKSGSYYAVDRQTGALVWSTDLRSLCSGGCGGIFSPAGFASGMLFLNVGAFASATQESAAIALDAATGDVVWQVRGMSTQTGGPAIAGGMVFIGVSNNLCALRASNGESLVCFATNGPIWTSPAVVDGRVYFGSTDGTFYVIGL